MISADPTIHRQVVAVAREVLRDDPAASLSHITQRAGVSRATFYRHFGSREALLNAIQLEPPTPARDRILAAAAELMANGGLHAFSMEELATRAGTSRATVYRLFPTKAAVFGELVRVYSPFEAVTHLLAARGADPPEIVVREIVRTVASVGVERIGIMRSVLLEATSVSDDAVRGVQPFMPAALAALAGYLSAQMPDRIRPMHPLLAVQAVLGPIAFHLLTRPLAERVIGFTMPLDEAAEQLASTILAGLAA